MDIARLGVALDPSPFLKGESDVLAALRRIEQAIRTSGGTIERDSRKMGQGFGAMTTAAQTAANGIRSAFANMSNAVGMVSPKLGFLIQMLQGFGGMVSGMVSSLRNIGGAASAAGGGFKAMAVGIGASVAVIGTLTAAIGGLLAIILPLVIAFKTASAAFGIFSDGLRGAASFENYTVRLAGMLGSMEKAEDRMKSLGRLAAETPFELDGIVQASIALEGLTGGMWSNEKALIAVGNAAARAGLSMQETADMAGRLYSGLKIGVNYDDPLRTLIGRGVIQPEVYGQLMEMTKAGESFEKRWALVEEQLKRSEGAMKNLSVTFDGRVSTMKDTWDEFTRTLGQAILPAGKDIVSAMTDGLRVLVGVAEDMKPKIQAMADSLVATFTVMTQPGGFEATLVEAGERFKALMNGGLGEAAKNFNTAMVKYIGVDIAAEFKKLMAMDFWKPLEVVFMNMAKAFVNAIITSLNGQLQALENDWNKDGIMKGDLRGGALKLFGSPRIPTLDYEDVPLPTGGTVSNSAEAALFAQRNDLELPFNPEDGTMGGTFNLSTPADGASGAELLAPFERNAAATEALTDAIVEWQGPTQDVGPPMPSDWGPGAVSGVFPHGAPFTETAGFDERYNATLDAINKRREDEKNSMTFPDPTASAGAAFMPTKRAGKVGRGGGSDLDSEAEKITASVRTPAEEMADTIQRLQELRDAGKISEETFTRASAKAREDYEDAIDGMTKKAKSAAGEQSGALASLTAQWTDMAKNIDQLNANVAQSISGNLTEAITGMIDGTKTAKEAFSQMAASIVNDILKMTTQMLVQYAIGQAMGWFTGGVGGVTAGVSHDGGIVGSGGPTRRVDPSVFAHADRYHGGGAVGLAPGEVPIIAQKGEAVMTEDQQAAIRSRLRGEEKKESQPATQAVTILNVSDPRQIEEHLIRNPQLIMNVISRQAPKLKQILNAS